MYPFSLSCMVLDMFPDIVTTPVQVTHQPLRVHFHFRKLIVATISQNSDLTQKNRK